MNASARIAHFFRWRSAPHVRARDRAVIAAFTGAGVFFLLRFGDWWFRSDQVSSLQLYVLLSFAIWYGAARIVVGWICAWGIDVPVHRPAPDGLRVAIFTTSSPGEPLSMFEHTLAACARVTYPHTTYLLDDTRDARFRETAERHGAVWLEIVGEPGAKAGKINAALRRTDEDFILVLDPDHVPFPGFLDRVLGQFDDERVGFVQVSQAYYNQRRTFVARGAAEQTYAFYGPTQIGLNGHGATVAIGANCTFRRAALVSIGGHGIGLAEDLVTSVRLHSKGWKSVYVPEIVSRGLVPEDLGSFQRQQLKWSRGVYEVLFSELPRAWRRLTWRQRLSYLAIGTYYLFGVTTPMYLVIPYLYLWTGVQPANMRFEEFVRYGAPVAIIAIALYMYMQRWLCDPGEEHGIHWRGLMLKIACWPVFLAGTILAVLRAEIPYIPTAKEAVRGRFLRLAWPHLTLVACFIVTTVRTIHRRLVVQPEGSLFLSSQAVWAMIGFAAFAVIMSSGAIVAAWQSRNPPLDLPWSRISSETG